MTEERKKDGSAAEAGPEPQILLTGETSPGVKRIEIIAAHFTLFDRIFLFFGVFLIAYVYSLDGTLRYTYQVCPYRNFQFIYCSIANYVE